MFRENLHESSEYQEIAGQAATEATQATQAPEQVPDSVAPVISLEKGDLEFWMQVTTVILLFLIYRELARANGSADVLAALANGGGA